MPGLDPGIHQLTKLFRMDCRAPEMTTIGASPGSTLMGSREAQCGAPGKPRGIAQRFLDP